MTATADFSLLLRTWVNSTACRVEGMYTAADHDLVLVVSYMCGL